MKKALLLLSILSTFYFASAQVCNVITMGQAPNAFGSAGGANRQLSYDKDLNTVAFIHRMGGCDSTLQNYDGFFNYDISTNGGTTWNINQPPIYGPLSNPANCTSVGAHPGRYPKGMIFNPVGNTNPASAHLAYTGNWIGVPGGKVNGTGHFDLSAANENYDNLPSGNAVWVEDIFITKTGASWIVGKLTAQGGAIYQDTITIFNGTWNGSDFVYTYYPVQYLVNPDVGIWDMRVVFNDNGMIGYIAIVTNQDPGHTHFVNSSSYIQVLKTEDGGQTWSCPTDLDVQTALDSALKNQGNTTYQTGYNIDVVIDANDNLHIITHILEYSSLGFPWNLPYGEHGMFDIYTTDGGNTYFGQLLAHPQTTIGVFGTAGVDEVTEFNRQFASRIWDGSKLFFGWFDTDTATFGIYTNQNPDLRLVGYDVNANLWTADLANLQSVNGGENITMGSNADGNCTFGNASYYSIDNGGTYSVPVNYMVVGNSGISTSQPCDFFYIDCAAPAGNFIYGGHPLSVPALHLSTLCDGGNGVVLGASEVHSSGLIVSKNYPNPFSGKTSFDITLEKPGEILVEIKNVLGQALQSHAFKNLHSGINTFTLDGAGLSSGLYLCTIHSGSEFITRTISVK